MSIGIKKLDTLLIKSFLGPFVVTFFVVLFALVMQTFWLYMDDLIGKGLGIGMIMQLLINWAATLIPMALPLGILLAAIMTFGSLGENMELVAIKSSGISLFRFMLPLTILISTFAIGAFFFNNYVIPKANLKTFSLLYDMRNQKPTMNIKEGIFNKEIDGFSIRVGKKDKNGNGIQDIIIYDHTLPRGTESIIVAETGAMFMSPDNRYLIFELNNGFRYETDRKNEEYNQNRMHFKQWHKSFDLSGFSFSRTKEELFKSNEVMMNINELQRDVDSNQRSMTKTVNNFQNYFSIHLSIYNSALKTDSILNHKIPEVIQALVYEKNFTELIPDSMKHKYYEDLKSTVQSFNASLTPIVNEYSVREMRINRLNIEWHKKFTLSFACILLFLIGGPLGAIIRKGGLGMPVVVAVLFFVLYFIISSTGEKLAKQFAVTPAFGLWLGTIILLPIAVIILLAARNDSNVFNKEAYARLFRIIKKRLSIKKN